MLKIDARFLQNYYAINLILFLENIRWVISDDDYANHFRQYTCIIQNSNEAADCRLTFMTSDDTPLTITDSGCFMELDPYSHELRNYCPLQCQDADFAYVIAIRPDRNHTCSERSSYNVVRRRYDWFLWRSNECLTEEVQFDIGCMTTSYVTTKGPMSIQNSFEEANDKKNEILLPPLVTNEVNSRENYVDEYTSQENFGSSEKSEDFNANMPMLWPRFK